ncbi:MAG TPA: response regulator transcription factor [Desulfuromonadales bacterium]
MGKIRVMVVDEHAIVRKGIEHLLENQTDMVVVGEAATGREALENSRTLHPDVMLLAIALPDLSGLEVIGMVRKEQPELQIVIFSSHERDVYVHQALRNGAIGYVLKSAPSESVLEAIRSAHRGEFFLCRKIKNGVIKAFLQVEKGSSPMSLYERLSAREQEVFRMLVGGKSTGQIAGLLFLSPKTVEKHRLNILRKLGCRNLVEMVKYAISIGITDSGMPG